MWSGFVQFKLGFVEDDDFVDFDEVFIYWCEMVSLDHLSWVCLCVDGSCVEIFAFLLRVWFRMWKFHDDLLLFKWSVIDVGQWLCVLYVIELLCCVVCALQKKFALFVQCVWVYFTNVVECCGKVCWVQTPTFLKCVTIWVVVVTVTDVCQSVCNGKWSFDDFVDFILWIHKRTSQ